MTLQYFLSDVHLQEDQNGAMIQELCNGTLVGATDGPAHSDLQDCSYAILPLSSNSSSLMIYGGGELDLSPTTTSQHMEYYEVISICVLLVAMKQCTLSHILSMTIWIDNNYAIDRLQS